MLRRNRITYLGTDRHSPDLVAARPIGLQATLGHVDLGTVRIVLTVLGANPFETSEAAGADLCAAAVRAVAQLAVGGTAQTYGLGSGMADLSGRTSAGWQDVAGATGMLGLSMLNCRKIFAASS